MLPKVGIFKMLFNVHFFFISLIIHELKIIKRKNLKVTVIFFLLTSISASPLNLIMLPVRTVLGAELGERIARDIVRNRFKISF